MKSEIIAVGIYFASFLASLPINAEEVPKAPPAEDEIVKPIPINQIKEDTPIGTIWRSYSEINWDNNTSDEFKICQKIPVLVIVHIYLKTHTRPEGVVPWNIRPPDGGTSGSAPESIKDPKLRAQYVKTLEENNAKTEKQTAYDLSATLRDQILESCSLFANLGTDQTKVVADTIEKHSKSPEQAKELRQMITDAAVKRGLKPTKWPTKSE